MNRSWRSGVEEKDKQIIQHLNINLMSIRIKKKGTVKENVENELILLKGHGLFVISCLKGTIYLT